MAALDGETAVAMAAIAKSAGKVSRAGVSSEAVVAALLQVAVVVMSRAHPGVDGSKLRAGFVEIAGVAFDSVGQPGPEGGNVPDPGSTSGV